MGNSCTVDKIKDDKKISESTSNASIHAALNNVTQLKHEKDINDVDKDNDRYPIHWAVARGNISCIETLIDLKVDMNVKDKYMRTPSDLAHHFGHKKIVRLFFEDDGAGVGVHV